MSTDQPTPTPDDQAAHSFEDIHGRRWHILFTVWNLRELRDRGHDWLTAPAPRMQQAASNVWLIYDTLPTLLADQMEERGLTHKDLLNACEGAAAAKIQEAWLAAFLYFFRHLFPEQIELIETAEAEHRKIKTELAQLAKERLKADLADRKAAVLALLGDPAPIGT